MAENSQTTIGQKSKLTMGIVLAMIGFVAVVAAAWAMTESRSMQTGVDLDRHEALTEPHLTPTQLEEHFPPREVWQRELTHLQAADKEQIELLKEIREEVR